MSRLPLASCGEEAGEFFNLLTMRQAGAELDALSVETEIKDEMLDFAVAVNREYFAGTLADADMERLRRSRAWNLWEENGKAGFWYHYLDSILDG